MVERTPGCACHTLPLGLLCFVLRNVDFILSVIFILQHKSYLLLPYFRISHSLNFTQSIKVIDCFCMLIYTMHNRFNEYSLCTVSYVPFYVSDERSEMTSIKIIRIQRQTIERLYTFAIYCVLLWLATYRKTSTISRTLVGNKIVDNSDVVGASPVGAAPTTSSFST